MLEASKPIKVKPILPSKIACAKSKVRVSLVATTNEAAMMLISFRVKKLELLREPYQTLLDK